MAAPLNPVERALQRAAVADPPVPFEEPTQMAAPEIALAARGPVVAAYAGPNASPRRVSSSTSTPTGLTR